MQPERFLPRLRGKKGGGSLAKLRPSHDGDRWRVPPPAPPPQAGEEANHLTRANHARKVATAACKPARFACFRRPAGRGRGNRRRACKSTGSTCKPGDVTCFWPPRGELH